MEIDESHEVFYFEVTESTNIRYIPDLEKLGIMAKYKFRIGVGKLLGLVSNSSFQKTLMSLFVSWYLI